LKLIHDELSNFAFKFNWRRYTEVLTHGSSDRRVLHVEFDVSAGAYTRPLLSST